ncbi:hypothetical protein C5C36_15635 [Rathayibacter sp. AY1G1]|uniref:hypothetical protein n=1 Tax=unclassified Rathayibacter TaxID=2609250 RepID=UPI000CE8281C|nr:MULTISPECIES: hypothetical protein [unclassified Rathayibacter]PPF25840.1 hypothetical protein C5C54_14415 [Rathayibacter sp. AY1F2]PPF69103.1 hypothetical protein C5C46_13570 [Rathayibacter sp. AY1E6]PPG13266.1 hypothetical protein C5D36_13745 [Rathayibacter sp. AY1C6]PPG50778.1 hypothetical protein C5C24_09175 [Rathayibacter sp. AY2B3]PPG81595.1 hypothetical protein C5C29_15640 [Rathayibacter sp. AY1H2]
MTLDPSTDAPAAADGHPQLGSMHKNGDRRFGIAGARSQTLADRGTPMLSSLYHSTVTEHVGAVRVGDELRVEWNGTQWWASSPAGVVGRLSWSKSLRIDATHVLEGRSPYDDSGTLLVQSVTVDREGAVVDCGGYVVPDGHDPAEWSTSTPDESARELRITLTPSAPDAVAAQPPAPRSFLRRLLGRDHWRAASGRGGRRCWRRAGVRRRPGSRGPRCTGAG